MAILPSNTDYTDKDFDSVRTRLFNLISGVFPDWTTREVADFGNLLVELYAHVADVLLKYQDNQSSESRWTQATQRKTLINLAKLIGYKAPTATVSVVDVDVTLSNGPLAGDVPIPSGTIVRTSNASNPVVFRTVSNQTIAAGATSLAAVSAENAEPEEDVIVSPGTPNYVMKLSATPYVDATAVITAANGVYTEVDNFLESGPDDRHYIVAVDQNDQASIRFGDGVLGAIPKGAITALYKTGGGAAGVVDPNTVNHIDGTFYDAFGNLAKLTVNNAAASSPATDRASSEEIRQLAPLSIRTVNRTVSREDYENNALKLSGVARALMLTSNQDSAIAENTGYLVVLPVGGGLPSSALKAEVLNQVTVVYPNTLTFLVTVIDPTYLTINVSAKVYLSSGYTEATVKSTINANLQTFFNPENVDGTPNTNVDFGYAYADAGASVGLYPWSDVFNNIRDSIGVRKVEYSMTLNGVTGDVELLLSEFPALGTVTLINGDTGLVM